MAVSLVWELFQMKYMMDTKTEVRTRAREVEGKTIDFRHDIKLMQEQIERLGLINRALWMYIQESQNLTEDDLLEKIKEADLMDGLEDGKVKHKTVLKCNSCGHVVSKRHRRCIYCNSEGQFESIYESF